VTDRVSLDWTLDLTRVSATGFDSNREWTNVEGHTRYDSQRLPGNALAYSGDRLITAARALPGNSWLS